MDAISGLDSVPAPPAVPADAVVEAFDDLFRREWPGLVRLAAALVGRAGRAEELVQDAFERTYLRWGSLDQPAAYLRRAVVNACRSEPGAWASFLDGAGDGGAEVHVTPPGGAGPTPETSPPTSAAASPNESVALDLGAAERVPAGRWVQVEGSPLSAWIPLVARLDTGELVGLRPLVTTPAGSCAVTPLGLVAAGDGAVFEVGCLGARYGLDGACLTGCGEGLPVFPVTERDGRLWGDPSRVATQPRSTG